MVSQSDTIFNAHGEDPCLVQPSALCEEILADAQARAEALAEGKGTAPSTPSPTLNSELDGGFPVGLTVLHGAPGVGKTAFALQCACVAGCPVLFITTELPPLCCCCASRRASAVCTGRNCAGCAGTTLNPCCARRWKASPGCFSPTSRATCRRKSFLSGEIYTGSHGRYGHTVGTGIPTPRATVYW